MAKHKIMDSATILGWLTVVGGLLSAVGLLYKNISESWRENRKAMIAQKREDLELSQLAAKFNIETVTGATTSAVSVLTGIADRLKIQLDESDKQITDLKAARTERDKQINDLQEGQKKSDELQTKMAGEMEILRAESERKDKVIEGQGKRIVKLEGKLKRLEQHIKENGLSLPEDWENEEENGGGG